MPDEEFHYNTVPTAACMKCGQMVFMLKIKGSSLRLAMDAHKPRSAYFTADKYGYAVCGGGFTEHTCDVNVVKMFRSTWLGATDRVLEMNYQAYARECPKCGAEPDTECWNLIELRKYNNKVHTKAPHAERYEEGDAQ